MVRSGVVNAEGRLASAASARRTTPCRPSLLVSALRICQSSRPSLGFGTAAGL